MNKQFFKKLGFSIAGGMFCCGICTSCTGDARLWAIMVSLGIFFLAFSLLGTMAKLFLPLGIGSSLLLFGIFILFNKSIPLWAILFYSGIFLLIVTSKNLNVWRVLVFIGFGVNMFVSSTPFLQVLALALTCSFMPLLIIPFFSVDSSSKK